MTKQNSRAWWIAACALLLLVVGYATCYFGFCESVRDDRVSYYRARYYRTKWIAFAFVPAACIESKMIGMPVGPYYPNASGHRLARYD